MHHFKNNVVCFTLFKNKIKVFLPIISETVKMKFITIFFYSLFFINTLKAQEPLTPRGSVYFFLGLSLPIAKVRDEGHSPLIYKGLNPTFRAGYERVGTDVVSRITFSFSSGEIKPKPRPHPEKSLSKAEINTIEVCYAYYRRLNGTYDAEGWNRYVGGAITFLFDGRNYNLPSNNLFGYQANLSLNAGGFVQKKVAKNYRLNDELLTPLLTFAMRPSYIGLLPIMQNNLSAKRILKTGKVVTVNKLFRFYNRIGFDQQINDHRQRRLSYTWDALINSSSKPLRSVSAGLSYESLFKM